MIKNVQKKLKVITKQIIQSIILRSRTHLCVSYEVIKSNFDFYVDTFEFLLHISVRQMKDDVLTQIWPNRSSTLDNIGWYKRRKRDVRNYHQVFNVSIILVWAITSAWAPNTLTKNKTIYMIVIYLKSVSWDHSYFSLNQSVIWMILSLSLNTST